MKKSARKKFSEILQRIRQGHIGLALYVYGKLLAEQYPVDTKALFTEQINQEAEAAHGRESYRRVCAHILHFAEASHRYKNEAVKMIEELKREYKRKPAFVDELCQVNDYMT